MKYILMLCLIGLLSCNNSNKETAVVKNQSNLKSKITIKDTSRYMIINDLADKTKKPFALSDSELVIIENQIRKEVLKDGDRIKDPLKYYKQLVPTINSKGEKEVWVNCFCSEEDKSFWKQHIVSVKDGGSCYFHLKINLTKKIAYNFMVNGQA